MYNIRVVTGLDECRQVWGQVIGQEILSDLWEVRDCFHKQFQRPARFIVAEDGQGICGLLPLSWIEETRCYGYFPGETWSGKTWLEQNRIVTGNNGMLGALLEHCPEPYHLRYLLPVGAAEPACGVDEIGYLFLPPKYGYEMENYFGEFSHKSAKRIKKELAAVEGQGITYRYDDMSDFDRLVELNVGRFGASSYFHDVRFREGFRSLMHFLRERGWLRFTTLLIGNEPAAIDMGCVYRGTYTLVAGGTHGDYRGIAKLINTHHMRRACAERLQAVDFLCGDFSWKKLFHLTPRPLYLLSNAAIAAHHPENAEVRSAACV